MTAHTPGPWTLGRSSLQDIVHNGDRMGIVAAVNLCRGGQRAPDEGRANARLIAAAPDLLAALERLTHELLWITAQTDNGRLDAIERLLKDGTAVESARAAIAKAKDGAK